MIEFCVGGGAGSHGSQDSNQDAGTFPPVSGSGHGSESGFCLDGCFRVGEWLCEKHAHCVGRIHGKVQPWGLVRIKVRKSVKRVVPSQSMIQAGGMVQ